jgi:hypothetical protein
MTLWSLLALHWLKYLEAAHQCFVNGHHGTGIVELTTIVWGTEHCDKLSLSKELIAILHYLVCTNDEVHIVFLQEAGHDIRPEDERHTTIILSPASNVLVWICPEEVANHSCVWHISGTNKTSDLVEVGDFWRKTSMHAHDFLVNESTYWHAVEDVTESLPHLDIVSSLTLVIETVDSSNGSTFVVASELEEVLWVLCLVREHQRDGLETLLATVHIVAQEDVVAVWWHTSIFKKSQ